jgi:hypothetical protein
MKPITVRIQVHEIASISPDLWATRLYAKLRDAGVPALPNGDIKYGTLHRRDDPEDFGAVVYEWYPPESNK